jgi:uncharacterized protein (DUF927 family)
MPKISPTNRSNPCPVCASTNGNCRTTETELILCRYASDKGSAGPEWSWRKLSRDGVWGRWAPASGAQENPEAREARQQKQREKAETEAYRISQLERKEKRDKDYRYKVANSQLIEVDRQDLERRGLTPGQIAELRPFTQGKGYVVPILDLDGLMVGGQVRQREATKGGRYRWATTGANHLPETGELPLTHHSEGNGAVTSAIYLTEGTGVKPYLASKVLRGLVIGAAGGQFATSPKTLQLALDRYPEADLYLVPDGGATLNPSVLLQYHRLEELIRGLGRELGVSWWGQTAKEDGDIDEIGLSPELIKRISWAEFLELLPEPFQPITDEDGTITPDLEERQCPYFESSIEGGLKYFSLKKDEEGAFKKTPQSIGNHLKGLAYVQNIEGNGAALLLEFKSDRGALVQFTFPRGALVSESALALADLQNRGYYFNLEKKRYLLQYLNSLGSEIEQVYTVTESTGWAKGDFVTQAKTYGDPNLRFGGVDQQGSASLTEINGSLEDWKSQVAARCGGNSRLILGLGAAFAAPLLKLAGVESGGFHLLGGTSAGKTTILKVAASVVGHKEIPHWRTTVNGLEAIACAHNHLLLPLDEIGQADAKDVGAIAYMLANGQGKTRMTRGLVNRKPKTWQLLFLSSGEVGLADYMAQAGIRLKGGQEVRMPDIPAVPAGSTTGAFENIHGAGSSKEFAEGLEYSSGKFKGVALDSFLGRLVTSLANEDGFAGALSKKVSLIAGKLAEGTTDPAVSRVANRFALVQVALGLAHEYGLLPFPATDIDWAIGKVFADWLINRGGDGSIEVKKAIQRIGHLLATEETGERFFTLPRNDGRPTRKLLGYREVNLEGATSGLWILPSAFKEELCAGCNPTEVAKELIRMGWLVPDSQGKSSVTKRINGQVIRLVLFSPSTFCGVTGVTGVTASEAGSSQGIQPGASVTSPKDPSVTCVTSGQESVVPQEEQILEKF